MDIKKRHDESKKLVIKKQDELELVKVYIAHLFKSIYFRKRLKC